MVLRTDDLQLTRGESVRDTAYVLSRHVAAIGIRTGEDELVEELAEHATVPVINMLSPRSPPVPGARGPADAARDVRPARRTHARLRRRRQQRGPVARRRGLARRASRSASPRPTAISSNRTAPGYSPTTRARRSAGPTRVYTDVWVSMSDDPESAAERRRALAPYRLDDELLDRAAPTAIALHCLPAHPGEEITEQVLYGEPPADLGPGREPPSRAEGAARAPDRRVARDRSATLRTSFWEGDMQTMPAPKSPSGGSRGSSDARSSARRLAIARRSRARRAVAKPRERPAPSSDGLASLAEQVTNGVLKPLGLVVLTTERIQEVLDDAAERGRVTRSDANELAAQLISRGRQQTDQLLSDVERVLGFGRQQLAPASRGSRWSESIDLLVRSADRARRSVGVGQTFPILGYDDLTAAQVQVRLEGLCAGGAPQGARVRAATRQPEVRARGDRQVACSPLASTRARRSRLAHEEARDLRHSYIGTEHILLGLLREQTGWLRPALAIARRQPRSTCEWRSSG